MGTNEQVVTTCDDAREALKKCEEVLGYKVESLQNTLEKIIEDHKEVAHVYKPEDVFGWGKEKYSLVFFRINNEYFAGFRLDSAMGYLQKPVALVKTEGRATLKELEQISWFENLTHISGPTFKSENRCKWGFEVPGSFSIEDCL